MSKQSDKEELSWDQVRPDPFLSGLWEEELRPAIASQEPIQNLAFYQQPFQVFRQLDSTMDYARRAQDQKDLLIIAEDQKAGRGQLGKSWLSRPGQSLLVTFKMSLVLEAGLVSWLPLMMGLVIRQALARKEVHCQLFWPNDLYLGGKKLGGILCEADLVQGRTSSLRIGFGLNVHQGAEAVNLDQVVSLAGYYQRDFSRKEILKDILEVFGQDFPQFLRAEPRLWLEEWQDQVKIKRPGPGLVRKERKHDR